MASISSKVHYPVVGSLRSSRRKVVGSEGDHLGEGSEGFVFRVPGPDLLAAKVFFGWDGGPSNTLRAKAEKLDAMLAAPPDDPERDSSHCSLAWPLDAIVNGSGATIGYVMPLLPNGFLPLSEVYNPKNRCGILLGADFRFLLGIARNLAAVVAAAHRRRHFVGDISAGNVRVCRSRGLVTLIDTDSFEISDPSNGNVYPASIGGGTPGFAPPEAIKGYSGPESTAIDRDHFALAALVFMLLMEGSHPARSKYVGRGRNTLRDTDALTLHGIFPYVEWSRGYYRPPDENVPLWDALPPSLSSLFVEAFANGMKDRSARPTAEKWLEAMERLTEDELDEAESRRRAALAANLRQRMVKPPIYKKPLLDSPVHNGFTFVREIANALMAHKDLALLVAGILVFAAAVVFLLAAYAEVRS